MQNSTDLQRFLDAQAKNYTDALVEIKNEQKTTHWMWYVFPQLRSLGSSETAVFYGIENKEEALAYYNHPILGERLKEVSHLILATKENNAAAILGDIDDKKLKSCMTLFNIIAPNETVFSKVLDKFFNGAKDEKTLAIIK